MRPQIMADPGHTEQGLAVVRGTDALNCVSGWGEIRRKRVPDAPDIAAALEADVELAIRTEARITDKATGIHGCAVGEDGSSAVKNPDLRSGVNDRSARLRGRGHELNAGNFLNSGNKDIAVGSNALIVKDAAGLYLIIARSKNSGQIAGAEVHNSIRRRGIWTSIVQPAEARSSVRHPPVC